MSLEAEWAWGTALPLCGLILATAQSNEISTLKMKRRLFLVGGGLSCLFYLLLVIEVEPVLKDTARRVAERTERRLLLKWGRGPTCPQVPWNGTFLVCSQLLPFPWQPYRPRRSFWKKCKEWTVGTLYGILHLVLSLTTGWIPWHGVNEFNASETLVKRDLCHVWVNCLLLSLSPDLTNKEKVQ